MTPTLWRTAAFGLAVLAAPQAGAQTAEATAATTHDDWSVFVADSPKECYIVSIPTASDARRGGDSVTVDRGDIRLFVTFRPGENVANEVSFTGGYPLRTDSAVEVEVGGSDFAMNVGTGEGNNWAWPASPEDDARLVAAMRRGADARITGVSARGTTTIDTFSLIGFTAAMSDAEARCN